MQSFSLGAKKCDHKRQLTVVDCFTSYVFLTFYCAIASMCELGVQHGLVWTRLWNFMATEQISIPINILKSFFDVKSVFERELSLLSRAPSRK